MEKFKKKRRTRRVVHRPSLKPGRTRSYPSLGIGFPSVRQPPLPWQEFLPLQPLSLLLQPPLPLQEFCPLQACFSFLPLVACLPSFAVLSPVSCAAAPIVVPATNPDRAAPMSSARIDFVMCTTPFLCFIYVARSVLDCPYKDKWANLQPHRRKNSETICRYQNCLHFLTDYKRPPTG